MLAGALETAAAAALATARAFHGFLRLEREHLTILIQIRLQDLAYFLNSKTC